MATEGISTRCWNKFKAASVFARYSPFFVGLAAGTLDAESFSRCISQDAHFLNAFAQAYELAADCAEHDVTKGAIRNLRMSAFQKLQINDILIRAWGVEDTSGSISDATANYRDFLLAIASGKVENIRVPIKIATPFKKMKVATYTLGAIAPCMRLYANVYNEVRALQDHPDASNIYKKWIHNYASRDFLAITMETEDLLDKFSTSMTEEELGEIENLYLQALILQVGFFVAQPISQQTVVPFSREQEIRNRKLTIFCDFDLTCSVVKSSNTLAGMTFASFEPLMKTWDDLSTQHTEEVKKCLDCVSFGALPLPGKEYDYGGLRRTLELVAKADKKAAARVEDSGILKGLTLEVVKLAGKDIVLQDGCRRFFQKIMKNGSSNIDVHVISHCLSSELIRSAFSSDLDVLNVHSNELTYVTTGEILKKVRSPLEKLQFFNILKSRKSEAEHSTVFIGSDVGDLLCLLEADIGILINSSQNMRKLAVQFGVKLVPLFPTLVHMQRELAKDGSSNWKSGSGVLFLVSSWAEIEAFIFGM